MRWAWVKIRPPESHLVLLLVSMYQGSMLGTWALKLPLKKGKSPTIIWGATHCCRVVCGTLFSAHPFCVGEKVQMPHVCWEVCGSSRFLTTPEVFPFASMLLQVPRGSEEFAKVGCVFKAVPKDGEQKSDVAYRKGAASSLVWLLGGWKPPKWLGFPSGFPLKPSNKASSYP